MSAWTQYNWCSLSKTTLQNAILDANGTPYPNLGVAQGGQTLLVDIADVVSLQVVGDALFYYTSFRSTNPSLVLPFGVLVADPTMCAQMMGVFMQD